MLVLAHRGETSRAPENTLEAFGHAAAAGADGVETDVRLSADGLPVLFHDRVAPDGRPVARLTRAELQRAAGHPVPTLDEALAAFPRLFLDVELKSADAVDAVVRAAGGADPARLLVTSFRADVIAAVAARLPVACGLITATRPLSVRESALSALLPHPRLRHVVWDYEILDPELLEEAARAGLRSLAWGAVTTAEHERCAALGLCGIVTDDVALALSAVRPRSPG